MTTETQNVRKTLQAPHVHKQWMDHYRVPENETFFAYVFDYIVQILGATTDHKILDMGCGSCAHSVRLAQRGFSVVAADFSESILHTARERVQRLDMEHQIEIRRENLLKLSFDQDSFNYIVCWGVLMHIPDVARAVEELARVLRPEGMLVLSEANQSSLEAKVMRKLRAFKNSTEETVRPQPSGLESWAQTPQGTLLTRLADIPWLIRRFSMHGLTLYKRRAGQFSEMYTRFSSPTAKRAIHTFNHFWFRHIRSPSLAFGNGMVFKKNGKQNIRL